LFMTDPVDEIWLQAVDGFRDFRLRDAARGELDLESPSGEDAGRKDRDEAEKHLRPLMDYLKNRLASSIREVRLSGRLTDSPACLVQDERDPSPQFAKVLASLGREAPQTLRILEINPGHPIIEGMAKMLEETPASPVLETYAELLYGIAALAEGSLPQDAPGFSKRLAAFLRERLNAKNDLKEGALSE